MEDSRRISEELAEARQHVKIWVGAFAGTALGAAGAYAGFEQTHSPWAAATAFVLGGLAIGAENVALEHATLVSDLKSDLRQATRQEFSPGN
jgi:hypothetical protein